MSERNSRPEFTAADYAEMADSYEREPPRRDERVGEPVVPSAEFRIGRPPGGGEPRGVSPTRAIRLSARMDEALEARASELGLSVSDVMRLALSDYLGTD